MTRFRVYCGLSDHGEPIKRAAIDRFIQREVSPQVQGFTTYDATGYWRGDKGKTLIIEIAGERAIRKMVERIAEAYRKAFNQEAVLVTQETISAALI